MNDYKPQALPDPSAELGHEEDRFRFRGLTIFSVVFALTCALAMVIVYAAMNGFKAEEAKDGVTTQVLIREMEGDFPQPRLQTNYAYDMAEFRRREDAALTSYGWVDRKAGIAQIPIDRAIAILAKTGLPKGHQPPQEQPAAEAKAEGSGTKPAGTENQPAAKEAGKKE